MMVCGLVPVLWTLLLTKTFILLSSAAVEPAPLCPPQWLLFGQRCFAFYPVWSSWSTANSLCSQERSSLASLHTPEERQFIRQLNRPVWLGAYQVEQNASWFWSDNSPFRINGWTNQREGGATEGGLCMEMEPKSGELQRAPCGELRFYICSTTASSVSPSSRKQTESGIVPGVSLFEVLWSSSDLLVEEILNSSSFIRQLQSGHLTERCYSYLKQQEALYLHRVSSTLEALISQLQQPDDMRSLLLFTFKHYSSRNQSLHPPLSPQWLHLSLQSFHSVVFEEPVYWLVALSARACLHSYLAEKLHLFKVRPDPPLVFLYQEWSKDSLREVAWTYRFKKVTEEYQNKMNVFKAINIFRDHMINQRNFYKAVDGFCDGQ